MEKWAQDIKLGMENSLRELDKLIAETRKQSRGKMQLKEKLEIQEKIKILDSKRNELRMNIYSEQNKIDDKREKLIEETKRKLTQEI